MTASSCSAPPSRPRACSTSRPSKELTAQTGHEVGEWPLVIVKELFDNALDACEEAGIAPVITVQVDDERDHRRATTAPGMPAETVKEHPRLLGPGRARARPTSSPTRGAQGNALKTIVAMPFVLDGERGRGRDRGAGQAPPHRLRGRSRSARSR